MYFQIDSLGSGYRFYSHFSPYEVTHSRLKNQRLIFNCSQIIMFENFEKLGKTE